VSYNIVYDPYVNVGPGLDFKNGGALYLADDAGNPSCSRFVPKI